MDHVRTENQSPPSPGRSLLDCEFDLASLAELRVSVTAQAAQSGLADMNQTKFVLAVHEVAVNAVRHGGGHGRLRLWRDDRDLWCLVSDHGPGIPAEHRGGERRRDSADRLGSGVGLWLVRQVCSEVRIGSGPDGGEVLLRFRLPG
jgi:anti-sigma regulatory factor (Ser/Thr protein kinase)